MFGSNPLRKQELSDGLTLDVVSVFRTIQGEGPLSGHAAMFVRLAGCNLKCYFCDTDFETDRRAVSLEWLLGRVAEEGRPGDIVVITGGEPLLQNIGPLVAALIVSGRTVQIETAGTVMVPDLAPLWELYSATRGGPLHIVCSPKTPVINTELEPLVTAWKYVLHAGPLGTDGLPVKSTQHSERWHSVRRPVDGDRRPVYVQPMDLQAPAVNHAALRNVVRAALDHGYIASIQLHKLLEVE